MKIPAGRSIGLAGIVVAAIVLQGCATVFRGTSQKIPVTSAPDGAKVLVDGREAGTTPLILKLKRKKPAVIRIEHEGYDPHEVRIERKKPSRWDPYVFVGNTLLATPGMFWLGPKLANSFAKENPDDLGDALVNAWWAILAGYTLAGLIFEVPLVVTDAVSGAAFTLSPRSLDVELTPAAEGGRVGITVISAEALENVTWLRIRFVPLGERR